MTSPDTVNEDHMWAISKYSVISIFWLELPLPLWHHVTTIVSIFTWSASSFMSHVASRLLGRGEGFSTRPFWFAPSFSSGYIQIVLLNYYTQVKCQIVFAETAKFIQRNYKGVRWTSRLVRLFHWMTLKFRKVWRTNKENALLEFYESGPVWLN